MITEPQTAETALAMYRTCEQVRDALRLLRTQNREEWLRVLKTDAGLTLVILTEHLEAVVTREAESLVHLPSTGWVS